jgi:hypothetical protein
MIRPRGSCRAFQGRATAVQEPIPAVQPRLTHHRHVRSRHEKASSQTRDRVLS